MNKLDIFKEEAELMEYKAMLTGVVVLGIPPLLATIITVIAMLIWSNKVTLFLFVTSLSAFTLVTILFLFLFILCGYKRKKKELEEMNKNRNWKRERCNDEKN